MSFLKKIVRYYVFGNIHLALNSVIFVLGAYALLNLSGDQDFLLFIFSATFLTYNLHRFIGLFKAKPGIMPERFQFTSDHFFSLVILTVICLFLIFFLLTRLTFLQISALAPLSIITFLYLSPVFKHKKRLRDFPFIKIFLISAVWSSIFILPGIFHWDQVRQHGLLVIVFIEKFLFIFALTLPFDTRDIEVDEMENVQTLPLRIGLRRSDYWLAIALTTCVILSFLLYLNGLYSLPVFLSLSFCYLLQGILTRDQSKKHRELFYLGGLDSFILVHGIIYLL